MIRYPGAKARQVPQILARVPTVTQFVEPFIGTGAVSLAVARRGGLESLVVNDLEPGIADLWAVLSGQVGEFDRLVRAIRRYTPAASDFYRLKAKRSRTAFDTVVIHQISYSGLGPVAGSPIGGREQTGKYLVDCRWRPEKLVAQFRNARAALVGIDVDVRCGTWDELASVGGYWYLDPPYYEAGAALYRGGVGFDHDGLADWLRGRDDWLLSYDACDEVRALYDFATITNIPTTSHLHHGKIHDVLITPRSNT